MDTIRYSPVAKSNFLAEPGNFMQSFFLIDFGSLGSTLQNLPGALRAPLSLVYLISVVMMIAELHLIYFSYTCNNCFNVFVLINVDSSGCNLFQTILVQIQIKR